VHHVAEAVYYPSAVEVDPRRLVVLKGVETGALAEGLDGLGAGVSADGLE
jgi:hypothetical protein